VWQAVLKGVTYEMRAIVRLRRIAVVRADVANMITHIGL